MSIENIAGDGNFEESLLEKGLTNAELDYNMVAKDQNKSESSQNITHQEDATRLEMKHEAVDTRHRQEVNHQEHQENLSEEKLMGLEMEYEANRENASQNAINGNVDYNLADTEHKEDKASQENRFEEDASSAELRHEVTVDRGNESESSSAEVEHNGNIDRKQETIDVNSSQEIITEAININSSVGDHNEKIFAEGDDQQVNIEDAEGHVTDVIQDIQEDNPCIAVAESVSDDVIENASKNSENTAMETIQKEVSFGRKPSDFEEPPVQEENSHINNIASLAANSKQGSDQSVSGENLESDMKPRLKAQHSNSENEPVEPSKPTTAESNVFSSPIRALGTVVKGMKNVVDLAELFVKRIDVMDSEAEDTADIDNGNQEVTRNLVPSNESEDAESTNISVKDSDGDAKYTTSALPAEEVTPRVFDNGANLSLIHI